MPRLPVVLLLALALAGCESQLHMGARPALPPLEGAQGIEALLSSGANGQLVTIDDPTRLPEAVRQASRLEVAFGGAKVPVTRTPGGYYTFPIPPNARVQQDVAGNMRVVFVMDDSSSQIITLRTGSPVSFAQPPVRTAPAPALVARGLDVSLTANTAASTVQYQFNWAYGPSAAGPWQSIPGEGKTISWTPPATGNFFIKVDAVDRATRQSYATVTPSAVVFVTDADRAVSTTPTSGAISRGSEVQLRFNRPTGLMGNQLSYAWSTAPGPQGPWASIPGSGTSVSWLPTSVGSYFARVEVSNRETGQVNTFVTPEAVVFVSEGAPIIQPDTQTLERGGRTSLTLNIESAGAGPFSWYHAVSSGAMPNWTLIPGSGRSVDFIANAAGSYHFRVDIPQTGGGVKSFTTTDPVLNVIETRPLIQTDPPNSVNRPGNAVSLVLNASGISESNYNFYYYVTTNPQLGWTILPITDTQDLRKKSYTWRTSATQPLGSYFVRVDAAERNGPAVHTFTSTTPVVTIQQ